METAHVEDAFAPLCVTSHPLPAVPEEGVVLRTLYAGVCHSDLHTLDDELDLGRNHTFRMRDVLGERYKGLVLGHEICGEVMALGSKIPSSCSLKAGDRVIVFPWRGCRACEVCSNGSSNICEHNPSGSFDIGQNGPNGGFSSHIAIADTDLLIKLPKAVTSEVGCMLPCSVLTSYHALKRVRRSLDDAVRTRGVANLLVVGAGGLGFWTVILVKKLFCDKNVKIIVSDVKQDKLTEISNTGADDGVLWPLDADPETVINNTTMSGYNKVDAAIDYVGTARTTSISLECLHYGGTLAVVGLGGGELGISLPKLIARNQSVIGLRTGNKSDLQDLVDLFAVQGFDSPPPLEYYALTDINNALDKLRQGDIKGRALIKFT